jgi:LysR family glycine cleavage system transcriptional activator
VLGVSPSAVSHLLRELELTLGVTLFAWRGPGAPLSEAGERLRHGIGNAFDAIDSAVDGLTRHAGEVRVSALSTFSALWLVPRLGRLRTARPNTRLLIATDTRRVDLAAEPYDCAIRNGPGGWPDVEATLLFREQLVVVVNPRLLGEGGTGGLARLPRIAARSRPDDWPKVLAALGLPMDAPSALVLETRELSVKAALGRARRSGD